MLEGTVNERNETRAVTTSESTMRLVYKSCHCQLLFTEEVSDSELTADDEES